jgi:hypothetical protein
MVFPSNEYRGHVKASLEGGELLRASSFVTIPIWAPCFHSIARKFPVLARSLFAHATEALEGDSV